MEQERLVGGVNTVTRIGSRVHRPAGPWSRRVQELLRHVRERGFSGAPEPFGFDGQGREVLSFLEGTVPDYPLPPAAAGTAALTGAARLLRALHDATVDFPFGGGGWQFPERAPVEVVCHGDFAPYNCVLRGSEVVGVIDFDTAHPGSRVWDVAYAAYRWVTLTRPDHVEALGSTAEQLVRVRLFCDAYGLDREGRGRLADVAVERLVALVEHMRAQAAAGNAAFRGTWPPGTTGCTWRTSSTCGSTAGRSPGRCWSREARGCCGGRW